MSDAIPPALTPEEWAEIRADLPFDRESRDDTVRLGYSHQIPGGLYVETWWDHREEQQVAYAHVPAGARHALAALALHGQPFGFDRAEYEALHWSVHMHPQDVWPPRHYTHLVGRTPAECGQLADRALAKIAALLPPETPA